MDSATDAAYSQTGNQNEMIVRPLADFPQSIWADRFNSIMVDEQVYDMQAQAKEIETLKEEARSMLVRIRKEGTTTFEKLNLIDTIEQLGISYHFEEEIDSLLEEIFLQNANSLEEHLQNDLYATALLFRLLRQHGFNISSGMFYQFLNSVGNFEESLSNDKKGLLSLYQAAYVRTHGERILDEGLSFTTTHLRCGELTMSSSLAKQVNHALEQPLHWGVPRIEARHYISAYEDDEGKNPLLLRFAKLDFSHLQMMYRKELDGLLSWFEHLGTVSKVPYSRGRLVECYFWAIAIFFQPHYSKCRLLVTKTIVMISILDDTYDAYGTLDELKVFWDALERWDAREVDGLPEYMKAIYVDLMNLCEWIDEELTKQEKSRPYAVFKLKEEFIRYVRTSYTQSLWFLKRELPAFEDYKEIAVITSSYFVIAPACLLFLESGTEDVFDWLAEDPKILVAAAEVGRFLNDIASHERERKQGATGVECYMKDYNASEEEAMKKFEEIGEDTWKDINGELLRPTAVVPRETLMPVLNLTRVSDVTYKHRQDGYTNPALVLEPHIVAVLLDLINIHV